MAFSTITAAVASTAISTAGNVGESSTTIVPNNTNLTNSVVAGLVDSHFGYDYHALTESSVVLASIEDVITPSNCHTLCVDSEGCAGWEIVYLEYASNRKRPTCELYSSVVWSNEPSVGSMIRSVTGDIANKPFKRETGACSVSSCSSVTSSFPFFVGPSANAVYSSTCDEDDASCVLFPGSGDHSCCTLCGLPGYPECDREPTSIGDEYEYWSSLWKGDPGFFAPIPSIGSDSWGCWSDSHVFTDVTVLNEQPVSTVEECFDACTMNESCKAWVWKSSKSIPALQLCKLLSNFIGIAKSSDLSSMNLSAVGFTECLPAFKDHSAFINYLTTLYPGGISEVSDEVLALGKSLVPVTTNYTPPAIDLSSLMDQFQLYSDGIDGQMVHTLFEPGTVNETTTSAMSTGSPAGTTTAAPISAEVRRLQAESQSSSSTRSIFGGRFQIHSNRYEFVVNSKFLNDALSTFVAEAGQLTIADWKTEASVMNLKEPVGIAAVCSETEVGYCNVVCTAANEISTSEYSGVMGLGMSYVYDFYGALVSGPAKFEMVIIDKICDQLVSAFVTTTESPSGSTVIGGSSSSNTTTAAPSVDCNRSGMTGVPSEGTNPFKQPTVKSAEACATACTDDSSCAAYNYQDESCELLQNGVVFDRYTVESADRCGADCVADSECHSSNVVAAKCDLYTVAFESMQSTGSTIHSVTGPAICSDVAPETTFVPALDSPPPHYSIVNEFGINNINVDEFGTTVVQDGQICLEGFHSIDGKCLKVVHQRLARRHAERACSDMSSKLFAPTLRVVEELCQLGLVDCLHETGRSSKFWTSFGLTGEYQITERELLVDMTYLEGLELAEPGENELDECVFVDFSSKSLQPTSCGAYCVSPATELSTSANAPVCDNGRLALKRHPFICEQYPAESVEPITTKSSRLVSYVDNSDTRRCAISGADIPGSDLWSTDSWAEPIADWYACEGMCRDVGTCTGFTYVPAHCNIVKEERDKGWTPGNVFSIESRQAPLHGSFGVSGQAECNARCASEMECNVTVVYVPGVCYIKSSNTPMNKSMSWMPSVSGPVDCETEVEDFIVDVAECPPGYQLVQHEGASLCVYIGFKRTTAPEAHRLCTVSGGILAAPKTENANSALLKAFCPTDNQEECLVPRGEADYDGVYFFGLGSTLPGLNDTWHWVDGSPLEYNNKFGGQGNNPPLIYNGWPTYQPDNTSGNQLCSYFYPRNHPNADVVGGWGDEDCDTKCLEPASPNLIMNHAPLCNGGAGRLTNLARRFVCTAVPNF